MQATETSDGHETIDAENVVERYVLGRLDEAEQEQFEDHFADCPRCLEAVELAQELRIGLRSVEDEEVEEPEEADVLPFREPSRRQSQLQSQPVASVWRSPAVWQLAAAVTLMALLPSVWLAQRNGALRDEIERLEQPWVAGPDAVLEVKRDGGTQVSTAVDAPVDAAVDATVTPRADASWITLAVDLGDSESTAGLLVDAILTRPGEAPLWSASGLAAPADGSLSLHLPRRLVPAGRYRLDLSWRAGDRTESAGSFSFEVTEPGDAAR